MVRGKKSQMKAFIFCSLDKYENSERIGRKETSGRNPIQKSWKRTNRQNLQIRPHKTEQSH